LTNIFRAFLLIRHLCAGDTFSVGVIAGGGSPYLGFANMLSQQSLQKLEISDIAAFCRRSCKGEYQQNYI